MRSSSDPPSRQNMNFGKTLLDKSLRPNLRVKDGKFYSQPKPKLRTKRESPIALPRKQIPKKAIEG